jgi:hypothetical protein
VSRRRLFEYVGKWQKKMGACRQDGDRTHGLSLIRRMLYPTELLGDDEI